MKMGIVVSFFSDETLPKNNKQGKRNYILLDYNNTYETRVYEQECWISTIIRQEIKTDVHKMIKKSSKKLKEYINGRNNSKIHLGNSNVIISKVGYPASVGNDIIVSMIIPEEYKDNLPQPSSNEVFIEEQHKRLIYANELSKYVTEDSWNEAYLQMRKMLDQNGENYVDEFYYRVTYRSQTGRCACNELWVFGESIRNDYICLANDAGSDEESNHGL